MTAKVKPKAHPAKFSESVLLVIYKILNEYLPSGSQILDPFAGVGGIHSLDAKYRTVGIELEPEWACQHTRTSVGSALALPFADKSFAAVVTSPCYGNRMADTYDGKGRCRGCNGLGRVSDVVCVRCGGVGVDQSRRQTYRLALERMPSEGSSCVMQWGPEYRAFHALFLAEAIRVADLIVINMSNHIRKKEVQKVVEWYVGTMTEMGCTIVGIWPIGTPRMRHGQNHEARVDSEHLIVMEAPVV